MGGGGSTLKRPGGGAKRGPAQPLLGAASLRPKPAPGRARRPVKKTVKKKNREAGQVAIADGLVPLVKAMKKPHGDRAGALLERLLAACLEPRRRRSAARGARVAAAIKGLGIGSLKAHGVVAKLEAALDAGEGINAKHGALSAVERLAARLGVLFEPDEIALLPFLLRAFSEGSDVVRDAAKGAARKVFEGLSAHGVKLAFPAVLGAASGDETSNWRARVAAIDMLGATAHCAPKQLGAVLPRAVPALAGALADTSAQVRDAAKAALDDVASVARNPEVKALKRELIEALVDPAHATREALDALLGREFAHALDAPSLALLAPILQRGPRDRAAETKRRAALVAGNLSALCSGTAQATAALAPHMPALQPLLEAAAVGDAHPDVRSAAARALAQIVGALGEVQVPFVVERLVNAALGCRSSDATVDGGDILGGDAGGGGANGGLLGGAASGASERSGAAQALSLVLNELGEDRVATCLTSSLAPLGRQETAAGREGALWCVRYLARDTAEFSPLVGDALGCVLDGLADDADPVREVALLAGKQLLIGELLCLVGDAKPVGVAVEELDDIDAAMGDEATGALIEEQIGAAGWRNTLSSLYIARLDAVAAVRQAAVEVPNTPRALRDILPVLVARLVAMLTPAGADGGAPRGPAAPRPPADASSDDDDSGDEDLDEGDDADAEKQRVASRALGDVVKKIGDRVVPELVPLLRESFAEGDEATRVGVCLGLAEVASATPQRQALGHLGLLAPVIEDALCGSSRSTPRVQAHAALAFHALYGQAGRDAVDAMLPGLLRRLDDDLDDGDGSPAVRARQALRDVLRRRSRELLPLVVPALLKRPIGDLRCAALSAVADVAGRPLSPFVSSVARGVLAELAAIPPGDGGENDARRGALLAAAADVAAAVAAAGFASDARRLAAPPPGSVVAPDASSRLLDAAPKLLKELLCCLGDGDGGVRSAAVDGLEAYGAAFDAEQQATHLDFTRVTLASAASDARWKQKRGDDPLPALSEDPRCLKALLPSYLRALLQGSPEARESAALGLGELVDLSSEAALKPLAIKVAGPLIRVVGDRFAAPVKAAILGALSALLRRGPLLVKAFVPQLQATFSKALRDPSRDSAGADDAPEVVVAALLGALVVVFANLGQNPKPEPLTPRAAGATSRATRTRSRRGRARAALA
ncbi:protein kinase regulator [Aureococcus anophagefferens]|nr:protein kinase regulator [Aureococcus anophagefferens]